LKVIGQSYKISLGEGLTELGLKKLE